jgi:hypothetical protein
MTAKLEKEKEGNKWFIHFEEEQEVLFKGLLFSRLLGGDGGSVHRNYKTLGFYANNVVCLREKIFGSGSKGSLNYNDFLRISECIGVQIFYLEKIGWTFYGLRLDEILVIDDSLYIFIGTHFNRVVSQILLTGQVEFEAEGTQLMLLLWPAPGIKRFKRTSRQGGDYCRLGRCAPRSG